MRTAYPLFLRRVPGMAKDVHQKLIDIAQKEGSLSAKAAADFVNVTLMRAEKRYLRDVY